MRRESLAPSTCRELLWDPDFASTYGQAPEKAESIRVIRGGPRPGVTMF